VDAPRLRFGPFPPTIAVVLAVALAAACTPASVAPSFGSPIPSPSAAPSAGATASAAASASPSPAAAAAFPTTLTDDEGTAVTIPAEPAKIVSLQPSTTEILFALGAGDRVVGKVEDIFDHPPEAADIPIVATFQGVDVEKVVELEPDLVIAGGNNGNPPEDIAQLRQADIPVLVVYPETLDEVLADIELVGAAAGRTVEADSLVADLKADIEGVAEATRDLPKPRTFYEIDAVSDIYGPADDSFLAEMVELAGGAPITTGAAAFTPIPLETLITADPEVIVLGSAAYDPTLTAEKVAARPGWDVMTAVRNGAVRPADDVIITRPGPRIAAGLADLARAIHPEIELPAS
jgi:iron complex transport system substrate-binding protein